MFSQNYTKLEQALRSAKSQAEFYLACESAKTTDLSDEEKNMLNMFIPQIELAKGFINPSATNLIKQAISAFAKNWSVTNTIDQKQAIAHVQSVAKSSGIQLTSTEIAKAILQESRVLSAVKFDTSKSATNTMKSANKLLKVTHKAFAEEISKSVLAKYVADEKAWVVFDWDKNKWVYNYDGKEMSDKLHNVIEIQYSLVNAIPDLNVRGEELEKLSKTESANFIEGVLKYARTLPDVAIRSDMLDNKKNILCVKNGQINLDTLTFEDKDPMTMSTQVCNTDFVAGATCPKWEETVLDILSGRVEDAKFFQKAVGYSLLANPVEKVMIFMQGLRGNNGKSLKNGIIRHVLGDYSESARPELIVTPYGTTESSSANGHDTALFKLKKKRYLNINEPQGQFKNQKVKQLIGDLGTGISAREMHGRESTLNIECVVFVDSNSVPNIPNNDNATWSRLLVLPYDKYFIKDSDSDDVKKEELKKGNKFEDKKLADYLKQNESAGILNWMLEGVRLYRAEGLIPTESMNLAKERLKSDRDPLNTWLVQNLKDCEKSKSVTRKDLWTAWQEFEKANNTQIFKTNQTFYLAIEQKGIQISKYSGEWVCTGKMLRTDAEVKEFVKLQIKLEKEKAQKKLDF
jgi:P4 family phage/plasmid primase-like protien